MGKVFESEVGRDRWTDSAVLVSTSLPNVTKFYGRAEWFSRLPFSASRRSFVWSPFVVLAVNFFEMTLRLLLNLGTVRPA